MTAPSVRAAARQPGQRGDARGRRSASRRRRGTSSTRPRPRPCASWRTSASASALPRSATRSASASADGFNDVFFAIGVVLFCAGLFFFTRAATDPACSSRRDVWALPSCLVRRLRLMLPGIVLADRVRCVHLCRAVPAEHLAPDPLRCGAPSARAAPWTSPVFLAGPLFFVAVGAMPRLPRCVLRAVQTAVRPAAAGREPDVAALGSKHPRGPNAQRRSERSSC